MDLQAGMNPAQELVLDSSRIRKELGYSESVPFEEAVRRTAAWERDNYPEAFDAARFNYPEENDVLARIIKRERDNNA